MIEKSEAMKEVERIVEPALRAIREVEQSGRPLTLTEELKYDIEDDEAQPMVTYRLSRQKVIVGGKNTTDTGC